MSNVTGKYTVSKHSNCFETPSTRISISKPCHRFRSIIRKQTLDSFSD
jgi:hypothetical protein